MDEHIKPADLSYLTPAMVRAARDLVDLKFQIDTKACKSPESIPQGICESMRGEDFFDCVLPFRSQKWVVHEPEFFFVPVTHTLGCSWRWWPDEKYFAREDERKIRDYIFSPVGIDDTSYTFIPELGLFLPGEGKNRVNFCRYHNIEHIPAKVYTHHYPEAVRIKLYVLDINGQRDVWAVLDNRYVQRVQHYALALPVLSAYGVAVLHKWPGYLPRMQMLSVFGDCCSESNLFHRAVIDAEALRSLAEPYVWCRLLNRHLSKKTIYGVMILFLVALVLHKFE